MTDRLTLTSTADSTARKVLVVGATGGSGRAAVAALTAAGHHVTAFSRHADRLTGEFDGLVAVNGDAMDRDDVDHAVAGQDAVVVTLGITENPLRVRTLGPKHTPIDVRSTGLDWTLVQPVHLTDDSEASDAFWSTNGDVRKMKVSRTAVGRTLSQAVTDPSLRHRTLSVSG